MSTPHAIPKIKQIVIVFQYFFKIKYFNSVLLYLKDFFFGDFDWFILYEYLNNINPVLVIALRDSNNASSV
jgi:hypothetical protein